MTVEALRRADISGFWLLALSFLASAGFDLRVSAQKFSGLRGEIRFWRDGGSRSSAGLGQSERGKILLVAAIISSTNTLACPIRVSPSFSTPSTPSTV
jgi:hypothetical protein